MIFWRSKENLTPPADASFAISPFNPFSLNTLTAERSDRLPLGRSAGVISRTDLPNRENWKKMVQHALEEIKRGHLQKVVLARETTLLLSEEPDPFALTAALPSDGAALFCTKLPDGKALFGASPERLLRKSGRALQTEALAATRKSRESLANFLHSEKALREFQFVETYCSETLSPFCENAPLFSPLSIHKTGNVEHLHTIGNAILAPSITEYQVLQALHPTPALCGAPKKSALESILFHEPFHRGYYGGVIGWQNEESSDWMVIIRCCLLEKNIAKLYTGAGIIANSDPDEEWEELDAKLALYKNVFPCML